MRVSRIAFGLLRWLTVALVLGFLFAMAAQAQLAPVDPSFQLVRGVPDSCSAIVDEEFRFETLNNVSFGSGSNRAVLTVEGIGQVATFEGNHNQADDYPSIGDGFYDFVIGQAYEVAPGTAITAEITTYTGLNQTGQTAYQSTLTYDCDLGETISLDNTNLLGTTNAQPSYVFDLPAVSPAFELTQGVPDTCSAVEGEEFRFDTFNNVPFGSGSNRATMSVEGVGQVATFDGNHNQSDDYPSIGNGFYDIIVGDAYEVPAGSIITVEITTYTGLNQTGQTAYQSTLTYDCDLAENPTVENTVLLPDVAATPAPGTAQPEGSAQNIPPVQPGFILTDGVADTCTADAGDSLRFDTLNNVAFGNTSNSARLSINEIGTVAILVNDHTDANVYPSVGAGFYDFVIERAYEAPQDTLITATITTFDNLNQNGLPVYQSTLVYNCSTGDVVEVVNEDLQTQDAG